MTIRTPTLFLTGVLTLLMGSCGAEPGADAETFSATLAPASVSKPTATEDSQRSTTADAPIGRCHGKCCNFVCGDGRLHSVSIECGTCNPYADVVCTGHGGTEEAWWGNCH